MKNKRLPKHSEAKIQLLRAYLEAYLAVISRDGITEEIFLADLFCGPGMYADNKPGSPVEIGRMIAETHARNPSAPRTVFLFNDKDQSNVINAESYLRPIEREHPKLKLLPSNVDVRELLPNLIASNESDKKKKKFFFVDPFGYKHIKLSNILDLLRDRSIELLLFQPCSFMFRFSEKGTPEALAGFMEELSGGKPWPRGLEIMGYIEHTKQLLRERLGPSDRILSFLLHQAHQRI
jgi:three-Cys-motif partner protein